MAGAQGTALRRAYCNFVLAPTALLVYRSSAVLQLPYCAWGTLITVLSALMRQKSAYSTHEHEALCAYLSLQVGRSASRLLAYSNLTSQQMVEAVYAIHSAGVLHCDIKTG